MIRTLVVDDEPLARARVIRLLGDEPDIAIVGECGDGREAVDAIESLRPDLVFLDVQMPELNGFEVLAAVPADAVRGVVFVTAYDEFALKAFDVHALDYLLKPVDPERLRRTLERVRSMLPAAGAGTYEERFAALLRELRTRPEYLRRIAVRVKDRLVLVRVAEIDWIEGEGNYVRLHVGARSLLMRERMQSLEQRLDPEAFVRIHRSTLVNIDRIAAVEGGSSGDYFVVLADGVRLQSTRAFRERVRDLVRRFQV